MKTNARNPARQLTAPLDDKTSKKATHPPPKSTFLILDFGSQYTWLIARSLRELGFYSQVQPFDFPLKRIQQIRPAGIVLSGGPASVLSAKAPTRDLKVLLKEAPLLGICYGLQLICKEWGGKLISREKNQTTKSADSLQGAYGQSNIHWKKHLLPDTEFQRVWMSYGDLVSSLPKAFSVLAVTEHGEPAAIQAKNILALQFHPEVSHTERGKDILSYFAKNLCGVKNKSWTASSMLSLLKSQTKKQVPSQIPSKKNTHILCALSGGVDSTVMACFLTKIFGPSRVRCVFVETGLLRKNEFQEVLALYKKLKLNVKGIKAQTQFLTALKGVTDPERKRKIIGRVFIDIFTEYKKQNPGIEYLAQGTLYPDVIESLSFKGPSVTIKSHHNVGGLPKNLPFKLVEPLRTLFKDEVRALGKALKIPSSILDRHPFPGPGLAVRISGAVTHSRLQTLQTADAIFLSELKKSGLYDQIWQAFAVLLPQKSVGVKGDRRTYESTIVLRAVTSKDGMTADWFAFPPDFLHKVSDRITNSTPGINRVVYDITSKPPGTIEWL